MKPIRYALAALALALAYIAPAAADTADVSWQLANAYTDGTALPATDIGATEIQYGRCNAAGDGFTGTPVVTSVAAPATTVSIPGFGNGVWCFRGRTVLIASLGGTTSVWSNMVQKTVTLIPGPPRNFGVTLRLP